MRSTTYRHLSGVSEYFILPCVSTQLLLREGVEVPDDLLHYLMCHRNFRSLLWVFLGLFFFCQKMVGSCVQLAGFSADALVMDRHRGPAMSRDSICFGVKGVCAVGCNRLKVLAALEAVKVTLDAAGLQCAEVEADTSKQVFTRLQLDHKTGVLSLEALAVATWCGVCCTSKASYG